MHAQWICQVDCTKAAAVENLDLDRILDRGQELYQMTDRPVPSHTLRRVEDQRKTEGGLPAEHGAEA